MSVIKCVICAEARETVAKEVAAEIESMKARKRVAETRKKKGKRKNQVPLRYFKRLPKYDRRPLVSSQSFLYLMWKYLCLI